MENEQESKTFNHNRAGISDKIALIAELEHARRHALRSATVALSEEKGDSAFHYQVIAAQAKVLRRRIMQKEFGDIDTKDWCLCKVASIIRQIAYELDMDIEDLQELDAFIDDIWGTALNEDLSDCEACRDDKNSAAIK